MTKIEPRTLKGFRDFLPQEFRKRNYIIEGLKKVFVAYGFEQIETPVLEYEDILAGKYGDEGDRLMYKFEDNGGRRVAMRYDQTVPLARVVAQYANDLPLPFKRFQISNVYRGENTQRGRFREFTQCDIDTIGAKSMLSDAEIIACAVSSLKELGFEKFKVLINDRKVFANLSKNKNLVNDESELPGIIRAIDKIKKIGKEKVIEELISNGIPEDRANFILTSLEETKPTEDLSKLFEYLKDLKVSEENFEFAPYLARGLDYYTGTIFEIEIEGYNAGSVCGGGRYDNLIGMFSSNAIPAVGCAFGFDRILEAMDELNLFHDLTKVPNTRILVTIFNEELLNEAISLTHYIRENGLTCELYLDPTDKLEKQLKYADKKGIMYAAVLGPEEIRNKTVTIKNLRVNDQQTVSRDDLLKVI